MIASPKVAVAYLRVSTEDQHLGPEAQRAAVEAWAARAGVSVAAWHLDQGVSGAATVDERPGLLAAIADLPEKGAGLLVVAKRDRLARDVVVAAMVERLAARSDARVVSTAGEGEGDDPTSVLMRRIVDCFAEYERLVIGARTKAALRAKRARGERAGEVPFGYSADGGGKLSEDPVERSVLARVRSLRGEGLTVRGIAERLAADGVVSRRTGRPYGRSRVAELVAA